MTTPSRGPRSGDDTYHLTGDALAALAERRGAWLGDDLTAITLIASLTGQAERFLPELLTNARLNGHTWDQIAAALATSPDQAQLRYGPQSPGFPSNRGDFGCGDLGYKGDARFLVPAHGSGKAWACPLVSCPRGRRGLRGQGRPAGPSRAARCAAPLRPEGRPRTLSGHKEASGGAAASFVPARAAGPPRSRGVLSRQGQLVIHRAAHAQRGVPAGGVVLLDPDSDPGPGSRLRGEVLCPPQL